MNAKEYNAKRGYSIGQIMQVQAVVGAASDGRLGPKSIQAIRDWQTAAGLESDGKVGPATHAAILKTWQESVEPLEVGIWWDLGAGWTLEHREDLADDLVLMGIDTIAIMVDRFRADEMGRPRWRWSGPQIARWAEELHRRGIDVVLTCLPRPTPIYLTALSGGLTELVKRARPCRLEMDLEDNWEPVDVSGYDSLHDAAQILLDSLRLHELPLEMTTFPLHAELGRGGSTVAAEVETLIPQCYSYCKRDKATGEPIRSYLWGEPYGPARMQRLGISRALRCAPGLAADDIICGLACFSQTYPDHSPRDSMHEALLATRAHGVSRVRCWSAKFIWGPRANPYARGVIGGLK